MLNVSGIMHVSSIKPFLKINKSMEKYGLLKWTLRAISLQNLVSHLSYLRSLFPQQTLLYVKHPSPTHIPNSSRYSCLFQSFSSKIQATTSASTAKDSQTAEWGGRGDFTKNFIQLHHSSEVKAHIIKYVIEGHSIKHSKTWIRTCFYGTAFEILKETEKLSLPLKDKTSYLFSFLC